MKSGSEFADGEGDGEEERTETGAEAEAWDGVVVEEPRGRPRRLVEDVGFEVLALDLLAFGVAFGRGGEKAGRRFRLGPLVVVEGAIWGLEFQSQELQS